MAAHRTLNFLSVRRAHLFTLAVAACLNLVTGTARAESATTAGTYEVQELRDVAYYDGPNADPIRHKLDLFLPRDKKDYPVLFLVHGGSWMFGDKSTRGRYSAVGQFFASIGIGAVLPNYRLSPEVRHPAHVQDVARAFAWTHRNIARYGGRPDEIFVAGHSAGGHLVALLATDETYLKPYRLGLKEIRGVIGISGVYRVPEVNFSFKGALRLGDFEISLDKLDVPIMPFMTVFGRDPQVRKNASPITHVRSGLPPFLILYAECEMPTLAPMAQEFGAALKKAHDDVQTIEMRDRNHLTIMWRASAADDPVVRRMRTFMDDQLRPALKVEANAP